jgi:hypothetical protein
MLRILNYVIIGKPEVIQTVFNFNTSTNINFAHLFYVPSNINFLF